MNLATVDRVFAQVPLGLIDEPVLPSRTAMDEDQLAELTNSIRELGIIQPISLARLGTRYEVIAGHRRTIAANRAQLVEVPAIVYPSRDAAQEAIKFAENHFREELNAGDEAIYFSELLERDCGGDTDKLCAQLRKGRAYVEGRLNLFAGDELVFEKLRAGEIQIGVAQALNRCSNFKYRRMLLHQAIAGGATVGIVRNWLSEWERAEQHIGEALDAPEVVPVASTSPALSFFTCAICGRDHDVWRMVQVNMHGDCKTAIFEPMIRAARGE